MPDETSGAGDGTPAPRAPHDPSAQTQAVLDSLKELLAAEFRQLKEQSAAELRQFKEEMRADFRALKSEFGELKEQFHNQERTVENLSLDVRVGREHERRQAGGGRYQRPSVPPDTETNGNGHTTYPWNQRNATPRPG